MQYRVSIMGQSKNIKSVTRNDFKVKILRQKQIRNVDPHSKYDIIEVVLTEGQKARLQ